MKGTLILTPDHDNQYHVQCNVGYSTWIIGYFFSEEELSNLYKISSYYKVGKYVFNLKTEDKQLIEVSFKVLTEFLYKELPLFKTVREMEKLIQRMFNINCLDIHIDEFVLLKNYVEDQEYSITDIEVLPHTEHYRVYMEYSDQALSTLKWKALLHNIEEKAKELGFKEYILNSGERCFSLDFPKFDFEILLFKNGKMSISLGKLWDEYTLGRVKSTGQLKQLIQLLKEMN